MIRMLQLVLGIVMFYFLYLTVVSTLVILPMMVKRAENSPANWKGVTFSLRQESFFISPTGLKFAKVFQYDSANQGGELRTYIEALNLKPPVKINDTPYAKNQKQGLVKLEFNEDTGAIQVPIALNRFNAVSFSFIGLMIGYLIFVIFLSYQLYHFARQAGRKEFFTRKNRNRLRLLGGFLVITAIITYVLESSRQWILESLTNTWGYEKIGNSPFIGFPSMFIAGILMFIIAEAFSKGQQLQTDQEYTI